MELAKKEEDVKVNKTTGVQHLPFFHRFLDLGVSESTLLDEVSVDHIDAEHSEEILLITTIKTQSAEVKAKRDMDELAMKLDDQPLRPRSAYKLKIKKSETGKFRNTTQGFGLGKGSLLKDSSQTREVDPMRESTMYFLKQVYNSKN